MLLVAFLISQFVQDNAMFDVSLFRKPTFSGASIVAFALSASMFAMFLYLVLYLQTILGLSPLQTGLRFLPVHRGLVLRRGCCRATFGARARRVLLARRPAARRRRAAADARTDASTRGGRRCWPGFIVAGAGVGLINPALASTAIGVVPPQRSGMASGINSTFRQVGIADGHRRARGGLRERSLDEARTEARRDARGRSRHRDLARRRRGRRRAGARVVPAGQRAQAAAAIHGAFAGAMNDILLVGAIVALVGAVLSLALVRARDFVTYGTPEGEPEPAAAAAG